MLTGDKLQYSEAVELQGDEPPANAAEALASPDRRDGAVYLYDPPLKLAIDVALVTGRPLLLRGKPGSGKSSLAAYVARNLGWRYYEHVVTARTRARDLLWIFDVVRRLTDAQTRRPGDPDLNDFDYVEPGVLWWVFNRELAGRRGSPEDRPPRRPAEEPNEALNRGRAADRAVVLLDEIDKADPDVPNDLLVPLGSLRFRVEETGTLVQRPLPTPEEPDPHLSRLLVILTTNEERELPDAFLRRCVVHELKPPSGEKLVEIAKLHFGGEKAMLSQEDQSLCEAVARRIDELRGQAATLGIRQPSTAEFLDAVRACRSLKIRPDSEAWKHVEGLVLRKLTVLAEDLPGGLDG